MMQGCDVIVFSQSCVLLISTANGGVFKGLQFESP